MTKKVFDVLGLGCTAVDDLLYVASYPPADAKAEVRERERHCGGLCATALVAGARLGARCAYAGSLGDDDDSRFVLGRLRAERVDVRHVVRRAGAGPVRSIIVVDEGRRTRTIFYDTTGALGAHARRPAARVILSARVLLVDRFGVAGMVRAARLARAAGIPVVGDFESFQIPRFRELLALVDHLIISADFAARLTGATTPGAAAAKLWREDRAAIVITCGAEGCWLRDGNRPRPRHFPAFPVNAVDTTGCGDVFHGAYAAALAFGWPVEERLRLASASAALKTTRRGGQLGIPTLREVRAFLKTKG